MLETINTDLIYQPCACCSGKSYHDCCLPLHQGEMVALTAEQLMRSRFTAFSLGLIEYLATTWAEQTRPTELTLDHDLKWISLSINGRKKGRKKDKEGWVTFVANYEINGSHGALHEKSYFLKDDQGRWRYVDGEIKNN